MVRLQSLRPLWSITHSYLMIPLFSEEQFIVQSLPQEMSDANTCDVLLMVDSKVNLCLQNQSESRFNKPHLCLQLNSRLYSKEGLINDFCNFPITTLSHWHTVECTAAPYSDSGLTCAV